MEIESKKVKYKKRDSNMWKMYSGITIFYNYSGIFVFENRNCGYFGKRYI